MQATPSGRGVVQGWRGAQNLLPVVVLRYRGYTGGQEHPRLPGTGENMNVRGATVRILQCADADETELRARPRAWGSRTGVGSLRVSEDLSQDCRSSRTVGQDLAPFSRISSRSVGGTLLAAQYIHVAAFPRQGLFVQRKSSLGGAGRWAMVVERNHRRTRSTSGKVPLDCSYALPNGQGI